MASRPQRTLYRIFMRHASRMEREGIKALEIQAPLDTEAWLANGGAHEWAATPPAYNAKALAQLLPWLGNLTSSGRFTAEELRDTVRRAFRDPAALDIHDNGGKQPPLDRAFEALRVLGEQTHLARCSSSATSNGIRVDVATGFVGTSADLDPGYEPDSETPPKSYFTYRVRISNVGDQTVQLLSRHWLVRDSAGKVIMEVRRGSRGVVGCTPILKPATAFSYYSGTDIATPSRSAADADVATKPVKKDGAQFLRCGSMEGSFEMAVLDARGQPAEKFDAEVAQFQLLKPESEGVK